METLVSTHTIQTIDSRAQSEYGIPALLLMEQAGIKGWQAFCSLKAPVSLKQKRLLFAVGGGNNGGDALVMAREAYLMGMEDIDILLIGANISHSCATQRAICKALGLSMVEVESSLGVLSQQAIELLNKSDVIIDGLAGTGLRGTIGGTTAELIKLINARRKQGAFVLAVDVPSGCADNVSPAGARIQADATITMGLQKSACYHPAIRPGVGTIVRVNPSFPFRLLQSVPAQALLSDYKDLVLEPIAEESYKKQRGHLVIFAGSPPYSGAARLVSRSAFRARCGLVTLFCDDDIAGIAASEAPSVIVRSQAKGAVVKADMLVMSYQAVAAGPGWGEGRQEQLLEILRSRLPVVLDADAIKTFANAVAEHRISSGGHGPLVLTPHPGEMHSMLEELHMPLLAQETGMTSTPESFIESLRKAAIALEAVLVYKSHVIWIADGRSAGNLPIVVDGMNSAMGVAGSGDVLTGIIGALLAQGMDALEAAHKGVLIHQRAGQIARDATGWFDSEALAGFIGNACREAENRPS